MKKRTAIIALIAILLIFILFVNIITTIQKPKIDLITYLPAGPIAFFGLKDLRNFVETFDRSDFGKAIRAMPLLVVIRKSREWRSLMYQKNVWEFQMGGRLDLDLIDEYFGKQSIIAFYDLDKNLTPVIISEVGTKGKLEISAIVATDLINPQYQRMRSNYREIEINTIVGYPIDFSYAFIENIGILSIDPELIKGVIDTHFQSESLVDFENSTAKNFGQIDLKNIPKTASILALISNGITSVEMKNRYENGVINSDLKFDFSDVKQFQTFVENRNWRNDENFKIEPKSIADSIRNSIPTLKILMAISGAKIDQRVFADPDLNLQPLKKLGTIVGNLSYDESHAKINFKIPLEVESK